MKSTVIIERHSFVILDRFQLVTGLELAPVNDTGRVAIRRLTLQRQRLADDWPMHLGLSDRRKRFLYCTTAIKTTQSAYSQTKTLQNTHKSSLCVDSKQRLLLAGR